MITCWMPWVLGKPSMFWRIFNPSWLDLEEEWAIFNVKWQVRKKEVAASLRRIKMVWNECNKD